MKFNLIYIIFSLVLQWFFVYSRVVVLSIGLNNMLFSTLSLVLFMITGIIIPLVLLKIIGE